jgi:DNA repair protein SbcC/Rad50
VRPSRLELQGFTSFRQRCEVSFSSLDLFAITGPTGAGKSSLLDAMTYALYGCTTRLGKSGNELVSQGSVAMHVILEFRAGKDVYQVYRGIKSGTTKGRLEQRGADGAWTPVTSSLRQLQDEIERIVGLDFEGFTKAVILPQGKFDELLRGDAAKRKQVLSELLNLGIYKRMMQRANEQARDLNNQAGWAESQIDSAATEEAKVEQEQSLSVLGKRQATQEKLIALIESAQPIVEELEQHRTQLLNHQSELARAEREFGEIEGQLNTLQVALEETKSGLKRFTSDIAKLGYDSDEHFRLLDVIPHARRKTEIEKQITPLKSSQKELEAALKRQTLALKQAEAASSEASETRTADEDKLETAKRSLTSLLSRHGSPENLRSLILELQRLPGQEKDHASLKTAVELLQKDLLTRDSALRELLAQKESAETQVASAEQHLDQLRAKHRVVELRQELHPGDECPVCEQLVDEVPAISKPADLEQAKSALKQAKHKAQEADAEFSKRSGSFDLLPEKIALQSSALETVAQWISSVREKAKVVLDADLGPKSTDQMKQIASSIDGAQKELTNLDTKRKESAAMEVEGQRAVDSARHQCELSRQEIKSVASQITTLTQELARKDKRLEGSPDLSALERKLEQQEDAKRKAEELERRRKELQIAVEKSERDSIKFTVRLGAVTDRLKRAKDASADSAKKAGAAERKLQKGVAALQLPEGREMEDLARQLRAANKELQEILVETEKQRLQIEDLVNKLNKNDQFRQQSKQLKHSAAVHHDLATLLNLGNFQQYLLGASFKLLAREGSRYFETLTDTRYSFRTDGNEFLVEDHSNADELRSVSTLSGGESFLASLSLALALAQSIFELSGERGAVALESLFLDEGFSTLDAETLSKVADALPALQKKDRLIGVITHVEALADQLPARIEIEKTATGSQIIQSSQLRPVTSA